MWGLENAYRDRATLLAKELQEELEAQLEALRKQIEASGAVSRRS
jgi:hypothetical protein